ncbi:MAG: response regulator [Acidimicrobiia bacterium]
MDELQQYFRDSALDRLRALESLIPAVRRGDADAVSRVRGIAHSLKGSGASYGFPEVSESAAQVESVGDNHISPAIANLCATLGSVTSSTSRHLVLVIDDDPLITRLLEARLTTPGRRVTSVASLEAARQFLGQGQPDLILLDPFLPDGDGRVLLREIRLDETTAATPVLVISGVSDQSMIDEVTNLGADGFIAKPFVGDEVAGRVAVALRRAGPEPGRAALTASYRALLEREIPISVVAVVPETHGPGGTRSVGPDPAVTREVHAGLFSLLGPDADIARWADGELAIVGAYEPAQMIRLVDQSRLRLRTLRHPTTDGAVVSFSASVVTDGGLGLTDAYQTAHQFAMDASLAGGDRVTIGEIMRRTGRVLLAEDDDLTAALIIHRLEREGFEVVHESDGDAALEAAGTGEFGIVVLDVEMPGKNGFEVLERLRSVRELDNTPIVMLTAAGSEREVVRGFDLGANDYVIKPFSPTELTARLKRFVTP